MAAIFIGITRAIRSYRGSEFAPASEFAQCIPRASMTFRPAPSECAFFGSFRHPPLRITVQGNVRVLAVKLSLIEQGSAPPSIAIRAHPRGGSYAYVHVDLRILQ